MLRSFRLGNHRSFREEQELLLMPLYSRDKPVVPVAAVYGANASGKSNLLHGLRFMREAILDSFARWRPDDGVPRQPFRLDRAALAEPSTFVVELSLDGVRHTYGFVATDDRFLEEWLYSYPEKRRRVVFERNLDNIKFGSTVQDLTPKLALLRELLRPNSLFISLAGQSNLDPLLPVYQWFSRNLVFHQEQPVSTQDIADFIRSSCAKHTQFVDLVRAADLGISDILVEDDTEATEAELAYQVARDEYAKSRYLLSAAQTRAYESRSSSNRDEWGREISVLEAEVRSADRELRHAELRLRMAGEARQRIQLEHGAAGERFNLDDESAGTRSWLVTLPAVLTVLMSGGTFVVDEIDASLHPVLVLRLVKLFHDKETNPADAQLIFTTHDATLLHPPLAQEALARDEIWFVEKGQSGNSTLYPLTDFKPRAEDNLERRYLSGKYGAVPTTFEEDFIAAVRGAPDAEA